MRQLSSSLNIYASRARTELQAAEKALSEISNLYIWKYVRKYAIHVKNIFNLLHLYSLRITEIFITICNIEAIVDLKILVKLNCEV